MSTTLALDPREIREAFPPTPGREGRLGERTQRLLAMAARVETSWDELPDGVKTALLELADRVTNPRRGLAAVPAAVAGAFIYGSYLVQGRLTELAQFIAAALFLADMVVSVVERQDPGYQEVLAKAVGEAFAEQGEGRRRMTAAELDEWSRAL